MLVLLLWHRGCLSDITGALFCCPGTLSGWFPVSPFAFVCCFKRPFCMFLSLNHILQLGASDHSVLYATALLTEGRSARDQPKQPPAKKCLSGGLVIIYLCDPSAIPSLQMVDGSVVNLSVLIMLLIMLLTILPRKSRRPTASLGSRANWN